MKRIFLLFCLAAFAAGCSNSDNKPAEAESAQQLFLLRTTPGAYEQGNVSFQLDEEIHQVSINSSEHTYRIQTDAQDKYLHCALSAPLSSAGQELSIGVSVKGVAGIYNKVYAVTVLSIDNDIARLWSGSDLTGFIVPVVVN